MGAPGGITIITDHEPLLAIKTTKNPSRMFLRRAHFIQQFSFKVQYRPGKDNPPDLLFRPPDRMNAGEKGITVGELDSDPDDASPTLNVLPCHYRWETLAPSDLEANTEDRLTAHVLSRVREATACDPLFKAIVARPHEFRGRFKVRNGLICSTLQTGFALYIPDSCPLLRKQIFFNSHGHPTAGHFGNARTASIIKRNYYWPGLDRDVASWIKECRTCLFNKRSAAPIPVRLPHKVPEETWDVVFTDETSGFPVSNGCDAIWIFICKLSKMCHFVPVRKEGLTAEGLADLFFRNIFRLHGLPKVIVSDRDARINNDVWRNLQR